MFTNQALKKLIIPLVIEQVLVMLVGMADTAMVSYAGEAAISGVALVDMFAYMIITILTAVATGGAVIVSQYLGSRDKENACRSASQLLTVTLLISLAITVICEVFHRGILQLFFGAIEPEVMEAASSYLVITALSFPFLSVYNSSAALFRSMEKTNVTMYVSLLMNAINVAGNAIGIFVLHAGVVGVAVPTLLSRVAAGLVMPWRSAGKIRCLCGSGRYWPGTGPASAGFCALPFPMGLRMACLPWARCWSPVLWPCSAQRKSRPTGCPTA